MPSPRKRKTLCIFGDSQIGCIKLALTQKLFTTRKHLDFEFWGADGPRFRGLDLVDDRLVPRPAVLKTVQMVNGNSHDVLDPADFDAILFMGVRIRTLDFFEPHLHRMQAGEPISEAVFQAASDDWLPRHRFYRAAKAFAAKGRAKIVLAPGSFPTLGFESLLAPEYAKARDAVADQRGTIWAQLKKTAACDGIILLPQPEETVSSGCMTKEEYGRVNVASAELDPSHRNPQYGALLLERVVEACF
ncbi:MAG: hypothetical protein GY947_01610 [Rhodobacteraceae bacterium]|nr:hypothetical protein [Paracoccaceae bacterium]